MLFVLWIIATAATTAIAYIAVNAAGAEVTDRPLTTVVAAGATTTTSTSSTIGSSLSTTNQSVTAPTSTPTNSTGTSTGTSSGGTTVNTTTSTTTGSTSSTSPSAEPFQQATIPSSGGLVIVSYRTDEVRLESVTPSAGFTYEINDSGPDRVRVRFESGDRRVEIEVRWENGLVTDVDEDN
jgi:hypothetical protein